MSIVLDGTTGVTAPAFDGTLDATDLTGDVAAARITTALNVTGAAPMFACRAFVNFNGTGTVAIRASGNVSSITDNGVGQYTVNFTTAMPDTNYCAQVTSRATAISGSGAIPQPNVMSTSLTTTSVPVGSLYGNSYGDSPEMYVAIFR